MKRVLSSALVCLLSAAALVCLLSAAALGQQEGRPRVGSVGSEGPPPSGSAADAGGEVTRLLKAREIKDRAWGAYLAGRRELKEAAPALVGLLGDTALGYNADENLLRQAALDGLIRLGAEVPAASLAPLYQTFPDEVVILLAKAPAVNRGALLELFVEPIPHARWLAVGNLLAETKAPGFAARLLGELKIEASVTVLDREESHGRGFGGGCGCGGCGISPVPEGFPPIGFYRLAEEAARGAVVVAPGRHPVYYTRSTTPDGCVGCSPCYGPGGRDTYRLEYLAGLLDSSEEALGLDARPDEVVICRDARQCRRALAAVRRGIEQSYAALVARLADENHLDGADASALPPDVTFRLYDERHDKTSPLPERLAGVKIYVE